MESDSFIELTIDTVHASLIEMKLKVLQYSMKEEQQQKKLAKIHNANKKWSDPNVNQITLAQTKKSAKVHDDVFGWM